MDIKHVKCHVDGPNNKNIFKTIEKIIEYAYGFFSIREKSSIGTYLPMNTMTKFSKLTKTGRKNLCLSTYISHDWKTKEWKKAKIARPMKLSTSRTKGVD